MDEQQELAIQKKAEQLTQDFKRLSDKYPDFDPIKTIEVMQSDGLASPYQAYNKITNSLDFEDKTYDRLHGYDIEKVQRVTRDNIRESLSEALGRKTPDVPVRESFTKETVGKAFAQAMKERGNPEELQVDPNSRI